MNLCVCPRVNFEKVLSFNSLPGLHFNSVLDFAEMK